MEQYLTTPNQSLLMDRWAEGILQVLVEIAPSVLANNRDYDVMSQFMLAATMALNGFISMGVSQDWATHMIGHELTALHGIDHAQSLAIVLPGTMKVLQTQKAEKILQYGARVWGILQGDDNQRITKSIEATETFFRSLGLATRLSQLQIGDATIMEIEKRFMQRNVHFGEARTVTAQVTTAILNEVR
ncbi:MAG: Alcohol dehydrogenase YqhD [Bacteroidetes bacterium ADurb.BinA245]|nr:MAG: Alcohol dehydrogenase YqhD [Bacteroidetes bacterium ADurb.BinA245]